MAANAIVAERALRDAFARYATGVAVITTAREDGGWVAVTVNSLTSVSLTPPLLLFSLATTAACGRHFTASRRFAVSVLRHDQQWISNNFARPSSSRWDGVPLEETADGQVLIGGALASFCCREEARHVAGDHELILGHIDHYRLGMPARPLAFFSGGYGTFTPDQSALPGELPTWPDRAELSLGWG
jgi:flavin reductase (DIM6/NTAB) family NADH-FMN oxidoreductase RutF